MQWSQQTVEAVARSLFCDETGETPERWDDYHEVIHAKYAMRAQAALSVIAQCSEVRELVEALRNLMNGISTGAIKSDYDETMESAVIKAHDALLPFTGDNTNVK